MTEDHSAEGERRKQAALRRQGEDEQQEAIRERENLNNPDDTKDPMRENEKKHRFGLGHKKHDDDEPKSEGQREKDEAMKKARANPKPDARGFKAEGDREVYDPVTGRTVWIRDAKLEGERHPPHHILALLSLTSAASFGRPPAQTSRNRSSLIPTTSTRRSCTRRDRR